MIARKGLSHVSSMTLKLGGTNNYFCQRDVLTWKATPYFVIDYNVMLDLSILSMIPNTLTHTMYLQS